MLPPRLRRFAAVVSASALSCVAATAAAQPEPPPPTAQYPAAPPPHLEPPAQGYVQYGGAPSYAAPPAYVVYTTPPPPPPAPEEIGAAPSAASWGFGAGLTFGDSLGTAQLGLPNVTTSAPFPNYLVALERRLGRTTWLTLNGSLSYVRSQQPVYGATLPEDEPKDPLDVRFFTVAGLLGVRRVLVQSIVDVSVFGAFGVGRQAVSGDVPHPEESVNIQPGSSVNTLLFVGGLALERRLIASLSARLSVRLLRAGTSRAELVTRRNSVEKTDVYSTQWIDVGLVPVLELFLYF